MKRIMFVCHGNICRSPMAELIFKKLAAERGNEKDFFVTSRATSDEEIYKGVGNPVYPPAARELLKHGISSDGKRAERLTSSDYGKYDMLIGMDERNIRNMHILFGGDPDGKISKLLDHTEDGGDVADPWYTGDFSTTYKDIYKGVTAVLKLLSE